MAPTAKEIYEGRAGTLWNVLCCPFACTIGLIFRSFRVYCGPCLRVLLLRLGVNVWRYLCCCWGWPYEDDSFFGAEALGDHSENDPEKGTAAKMESDTDWVRAHELDGISGKRPQLFEGDIEPEDLCQGAVGDCWLVAAFACASEFPHLIRNLFITKEYNPRGLYKVRVYDPIKKKFQIVKVDDRIPCKKGTNQPIFMKPNGNELWAIILEKAYAKFCGSYAKLDGGFVLWGWHAMTGDNVFQMSRNPDKTWFREDLVPIKDPKDRRACGFRKTKEAYSEEQIWTLLKKYDKQKALISASIGKSDYGKFSGPNGEELLEGEGLVAGHAYSVLQAIEVTDTKEMGLGVKGLGEVKLDAGKMNSNARRYRLVQLRNPWGTFEWKGNWSDKSARWKKHPNIAKKVGFVDADDGSFWMSYDDFRSFYTRINVCDRTTSNDHSLDINEDDGSCGIIKGWLCGCFQFWVCCNGVYNLYCGHESTDKTLDAREKRFCCC